MSSEILAVLEYMEKEKGISREDMIATIEGAVKAAAERGVNSSGDIRVEINPKNGAMQGLDTVKWSSPSPTLHVKFILIKHAYMPRAPKVGDVVERD